MKAYPFIHKHPTTGNTKLEEGMDLRDWFAGLAMQGSLAHEDNVGNNEVFAGWCYEIADAMLKAREVKHD